jgi:hypothetical protein
METKPRAHRGVNVNKTRRSSALQSMRSRDDDAPLQHAKIRLDNHSRNHH